MPPQNLQAAVAEVLKERKDGDTPEVILQRVKDRMAQPAEDPTPWFIKQREQGGDTIYDTPQVSPDEPSTFAGGFLKSLKDQFLGATVNNPQMQSAANPQSLGDFLQFLIPSGVDTAVRGITKTIPRVVSGVGRAMDNFSKEYHSAIGGVSGKIVKGVGDLAQTPLSKIPTLFQDAAETVRTGRPASARYPNTGGTLVGRPATGPSLEEELMAGLDEVRNTPSAQPKSVGLPTSGDMTKGGRPAITAEQQAELVRNAENAPAQSRLVTPNSANRGGTLVSGQPAKTLEEEIAAQLAAGGEGPAPVELPTRGDITKGGRPAVTEAEQSAINEAATNAPDKSRLVNPNSANRGGTLVPGQPTQSLEEELLSGLTEGAPAPKSVELPPQPTTTDASTARQSGRFKKKGQLGQAGRYDSGTPSVTKQGLSDIEDQIATVDATTNPSTRQRMGAWSPETADPSTALVDEVMGTAPAAEAAVSGLPSLSEALAKVEANPRALPEQLDPTDWTQEDWQNARDMWGSRNVANMTGTPIADVQRLAPLKRGQPIYVDMIKRAEEAGRKFEWE